MMPMCNNQIDAFRSSATFLTAFAAWPLDARQTGVVGRSPTGRWLPVAIAAGGTGGGAAGQPENRPHKPVGGDEDAGGDADAPRKGEDDDESDDDTGLGTVEGEGVGPGGTPTLTTTVGEVNDAPDEAGKGGGGATPSGGG